MGLVRPQEGNNGNAHPDRKSCGKCGLLHEAQYMVDSNSFYGCNKRGHMITDFPYVKNQAKADTQPRPNPSFAVNPPKMNRFYALKGIEKQDMSANMVISKLHVFSFPQYALLDQGYTLSFVTPLVLINFTCFHRSCMNLFQLVPLR